MKRLVLCTLCLFAGALQALPVGNPGEASLYKNGLYCETNKVGVCDPDFKWYLAWSLRLGFYGDYCFNRHMHTRGHRDAFINNKPIQRMEIFTNAAYLALNFCNRIDLFSSLGGTKIDEHFNGSITWAYGCAELEYNTNFSWSLGARATLLEWKCLLVGLEGQYFSVNNDIKKYCESHLKFVPVGKEPNRYESWQVGLGVSYVIATSCPRLVMAPYLAATWSDARIRGGLIPFTNIDGDEVDILIPSLKNTDSWGFAVGTTFNLCDEVGVSVEGRYGSEVGLYVNGQLRF